MLNLAYRMLIVAYFVDYVLNMSKTCHRRQMPMASSANADCRWYHRQMPMAPRPHRQMPMVSSANADGDLDLVGRCRWSHRQMPMTAKTSSANADDGVLSTDVRVLRLGTSGLRLTTVPVTCFLFSLRR